MALFKGYAMKKLLSLLLLSTLLLFPACHKEPTEEPPAEDEVAVTATVVKIEEKIEVNVTESPVSTGPYLVIISDTSVLKNKKGKSITKDDLAVGDVVRITYSGQIMMSIPPQIVALTLQVQ